MNINVEDINRRIFTEEQQYFLLKKLESFREVRRNLKELDSKKEKTPQDSSIEKSLNLQKALINKSLEPFAKRYKIYKEKADKIIESHGYGPADVYDSETIGEILSLQRTMREESSKYTENLIDRKPIEKIKRFSRDDDLSR